MDDREALKRIAEKLRRFGANIPAPQETGTKEGCIATGLCIALALVESEIEALEQPAQPAQPAPVQEPVAWNLADKVRQDLDRQSCPDAFMRIAVESIVKHHPPQRIAQNFCPQCGKRTADPFTIHTCTPPKSAFEIFAEKNT